MDREQQEALLDIVSRLSPADRSAVTSFAEFLLNRSAVATTVPAKPTAPKPAVPEPENIARPAEERVVAAIKRLSKTYPMLNKSAMLGVTSDLLTQHILQGREAGEVIDELERIFAEEYRKLKEASDG